MTTAKRQKPQRFAPVEGEEYENAGGGRYYCDKCYSDSARMINVVSGWSCLAHRIVRYEDGTIEWDYSTGGHFKDLLETSPIYSIRRETEHRQRSILNAMLCMI